MSYNTLQTYKKFTINSKDEQTKEDHIKKLLELSKPEGQEELVFYPDGRVYRKDQLLAEEPDYYQKRWVLFRLSHSNTWPKVHENKIGDVMNWK